jgi:hypothetical protein
MRQCPILAYGKGGNRSNGIRRLLPRTARAPDGYALDLPRSNWSSTFIGPENRGRRKRRIRANTISYRNENRSVFLRQGGSVSATACHGGWNCTRGTSRPRVPHLAQSGHRPLAPGAGPKRKDGYTPPASSEAFPRLERLTELPDLVEADEAATERDEGEVDIGASLVAYQEATRTVEPGVRALHDPTVSAEALAAVDPAPGDAGRDAAGATLPAAAAMVVALVSMEFVRAPPRATAPATAEGRNSVQSRGEHLAVVLVGRSPSR